MDQLNTTEYQYLGWKIEIRCSAQVSEAGDAPRVVRFTASAHASLNEQSESGELWVDARTQVVNLGNRHFSSENSCVEALLADVKELIDALKK